MRSLIRIMLSLAAVLLFGMFSICQAASISGSIINGTGAPITGRLYVMLEHTMFGATGYGTSYTVSGLAAGATVAYTVRGVNVTGDYTVRAFLDTRGTGFPYSGSPVGQLTPVNVPASDSTVTGKDFPIGSQGAQTLTTINNVVAHPINNGVLVTWDPPQNGYNFEIANSYNIYWNTTGSPSSSNYTGKLENIASHNDGHAFIPLTNGGQYYFAVEAVLAGATGSPLLSASTPKITIGPAAGEQTVTATVNFDAAPSGRLLALLMNSNHAPVAGTYIATPTQIQTVTISGVPDGNYQLFLLLDKVDDKTFSTGDVTYSELDWRQPLLAVAGAPVNLGSYNMTVSRAIESSLSTQTLISGGGTSYRLDFIFAPQEKRPAHLTITSGPQMTVTDLTINSWGEFWSSHPIATVPSVGNTYAITVTYTDGTQDTTLTKSVSDVITVGANQTYPAGLTAVPSSTLDPWFSWNTLAGRPNSPYVYHVMLQQANTSGDYLFETILPPDRNSVEFTGGTLSTGTTYNWGIEMIDSRGNRSTSWTSFTPQDGGPTINKPGGMSDFTLPCGNATPLTIYGTGFSSTPANNSIYLNNTQYPITPTAAAPDGTSLTFQLPNCTTTPSPTGPVIINVAGKPSVGSHGEFTPTFTYSGSVVDSSNLPLSGATVALDATDPIATTPTAADGRFQLVGVPTGKLYRLKVTNSGLIPLYTAYMHNTTDTQSSFPYTMFATSYLSTWGNTAGKGIIRAKTRGDNGVEINGATVTAFSSRNNAPYTVTYGTNCDQANSTTPVSTSIFCVKNVEDSDWVTVTASKPSAGLTFNKRIFQGKADAIGQSGLTAPITFPIATSGAAMGFSFDGTNYLVGIENHLTSPTSIGAQLLSGTGTKVGGLISTGRTGIATATAFDGDNHLLIWEDNEGGTVTGQYGYRIYGQRINRAGATVGSPFNISSPTNPDLLGALFDGNKTMAFGGGKFLVTYTYLLNPALGDTATNRAIAGRIVNPDGSVNTLPGRISTGYGKASDVAFDGTNFFVVWQDGESGNEIHGRLVSPAGGLMGTEVVVNASAAPSDNPKSVVFDGTNYMVVWSDEVGGMGTGTWDVLGQRVNTSGTLVGPTPITITSETGAQIASSVSFDGTNYLVTWMDMTNPDNWDVFGQFVAKDTGALSGTKVTIYQNSGNQMGGAGFVNGKYLALINTGVVMGEGGITQVEGVNGFFRPPLTPLPSTPTISSFNPASGTPGSTTVTINGTNFVNGATTVSFNGVVSTAITFVSASQITVTVPTGATTGTITVTTSGGSVTSGSPFTTTLPPTISSFTPNYGSVGDQIVITGTNFINVQSVSIATVNAPVYTVNSPTQITATVPAGVISGTISVTTTAGTATSVAAYAIKHTLTVSKTGSGAGNVTAYTQIPSATVSCTIFPCLVPAAFGTQVTLVPLATTGSSFGGWTDAAVCSSTSDNTCYVDIDNDKSITATFSLLPFRVNNHYFSILGNSTDSGAFNFVQALEGYDNIIYTDDDGPFDSVGPTYDKNGLTAKLLGGYTDIINLIRSASALTPIKAPLTIKKGTLVLDRIIVK
ncbi:IPT/TIG domain-containing protein [Trichlorobacter thiogenes]|uniref:IPT/TIG domain-containing protein n=1 Tax=Trichlorobacter thiogenes TaxID=115783 RepID=A0A1T4PB43_9BACT|nr:IPT/TIG domain-containing protein [Trichlorobacter thiogenes]SJZ88770.1 IPT/TIG domain-containing protein [Trichlorobacter thiogenes]